MKYIVVYNPKAGNGAKLRLLKGIKQAFADADNADNLVVVGTKARLHAKQIAEECAEKYGENATDVAFGGDGTINEIANGLAGTTTPMMVLPCGTANDFCKKFYGKKVTAFDVCEAMGLLSGMPNPAYINSDMIKVNGKWSLNIMSFGFDTEVVRKGRDMASKMPFFGQLNYKMAVVPCVFGNNVFKADADLNLVDENGNVHNEKKEVEFTLMAVCNGSYYGGGFYPAPNASITDGVLELCIADRVEGAEILKLAPLYMKGVAHEKSDKVNLYRTVSGRIKSLDGTFFYNCDGESIETDEVNYEVAKGALRLCCMPDYEGAVAELSCCGSGCAE